MLPLMVMLKRTIAATISISALKVSIVSLDMILPPITLATLVGVMKSLASSPRSRSPAIDSPIPIMAENMTVMASIAGTRKSMYLISP